MSASFDATGVMYWHAGVLLCRLLRQSPTIVAKRHTVELGCGAGLLSAAAALAGAACIAATDGEECVLPLAAENIQRALRECGYGRWALDAGVSLASHAPRTWALRCQWGDAASCDAVTALHGQRFEVVVAAEVLYVHTATGTDALNTVLGRAAALLSCARRVLLECTAHGCASDARGSCSSTPAPSARAGEADKHDCSDNAHAAGGRAGFALVVYTPRYRGMSVEVHRAAQGARMHVARLDTSSILTEAMRSSLRFGRTRLLIACECAQCLQEHMAAHDLVALPMRSDGGDMDSDSDSDDDNSANPFANLCVHMEKDASPP